jgi:RNA polymerase sigma-70 factor (ECF subfamily)
VEVGRVVLIKPDPERAERVREALERWEGPLMRFATRITRDLERARDVVQETFLRLWQADRSVLEGRLAPWLFTVCRNRALDMVRKESRMQRNPLVLVADHLADGPDVEQERREGASRIARVLAGLTPNQQEVVRLKFEGGLSYKEIAEVSGLSVSNVGFLLHVALKRIKSELGATDEGAAAPEVAS